MAERWYGGWDSGINSEVPSATATKPPSCSGHESVRPPGYLPAAYGTQQAIGSQQNIGASSQDMDFSQNTPVPIPPSQPMQSADVKSEATFGVAAYNQPPPPQPQQIRQAPFTPTTHKPSFSTPQPPSVSNSETSDDGLSAQAIPKLIELLRDEDLVVVSHACVLIFQMSKSERNRQLLISHQQIIETLVSTLSCCGNPEIVRNLTATLHSLSQTKQGLRVICQFGCIPSLIYVLQWANTDQTTLHYALTMLHNALLQEAELSGVKQAARSAHGAAVLTCLLSRDNPKFLAILTDCIHVLCQGHNESKLAVVCNGGPQQLVRILRTQTYEKLLWTVSRLIKVLSTCQQNKAAIIEAGGMHALTAHLSQPSTRLVMNCLWSLRNLSDAATKQTGLDHLMHFLLNVLSEVRDRDMVSCAIGVLSNLTCNNQHNKIVICNAQGVEIILHVLTMCGMDRYPDILEPGIFTLRHLTSRHPASEQAQAAFRNRSGIPFVSQLLNAPWSAIRPPIVKAACGLLRNLAVIDANQPVLIECGCLHRLADILVPAACELKNAAEAGCPAPKSQDGTRLDDLAEQAAAAVHAMLRDPACRQLAKQTNIPQALMQLSNCPLVNDAARKQVAGALTELANHQLQPQQPQPQPQERLQMPPQQQPQYVPTGSGSSSVPPPQSVPPQPAMTPMLYQPSQTSIQQPQTPKQQRPSQPQPQQYQMQQQQQQQQQYPLQQMHPQLVPASNESQSLPQSPYQPPRIMSTQPMSVPPPSQQQMMMTPIVDPTPQPQQLPPAHQQQQQQQQQYSTAMPPQMQQQQQQAWYQPQQPELMPPQAHQLPHHLGHQPQYISQYVASPQHFGY